LLFHHQGQSNTRYQPTTLQLLPLDQAWLNALQQKPWSSPASPSQGAEQNIGDRLDELTMGYRQQRQNAITGELLDIVGGFEALNSPH
jgi:F-type H+-transporting ATPase subunit gamma